MSYQALYRVWRPQNFKDVVGQEHVTTTLQNALLHEKISHAYLFSGPRGTGKTSAAKILAKAVNCECSPVSEPCNECAACRGITDGSIQDVIEIDAASNNGVEEIRDIRDKVKYAPSSVKYKVYIIDEVHMLSIGAFNALLKTLEEPPKHVIFILATTEPHKIPLTIISRCQRFDFKRITTSAIVNRMKLIADESGIRYDEQALHIIARRAEGGMRDALSLLDQAVSFSGDMLTTDDALTVTGSVAQTYLNQLVRSVFQKDVHSALQSLEELLASGKDPSKLTEDLIFYLRDLLLYQTAPNLEDAYHRVVIDEPFRQLAEEVATDLIYEYIDVLNKAQQEMKFSNQSRIYLEVSLVKLCQIERSRSFADDSEVQQLLQRVKELEREVQQLKQGAPKVVDKNQSTNKRAVRSSSFKVPVGRVEQVLKEATRQDLNLIKSRWGDLLESLNNRQMRSQAALLNEAEPVAASPKAFILKFKYEIHCQMAMENQRFLEALSAILEELVGVPYAVIGVPEKQWGKIREDFIRSQKLDQKEDEKEEDPVVANAVQLVGSDLIEIID
jgi:DNA polymerase III subunit gamma/tau